MEGWQRRVMHLRSVSLNLERGELPAAFPFTIPAVSQLADEPLRLDSPVTFFVGENGSGKSTLLEAIAIAARSITVGTAQAASDPSLSPVKRLADQLRLSWGKRTHRGFFMRAEDFFGFARGMQSLRDELIQQLREIESDRTLSEASRAYAAMPFASQLSGLSQSYGEGLDTRSHGEAFLALFQERLVPDGFYLLDEPEAPLSPRRQLSLLAMLRDAVDHAGAQFVIATHSPILMAYPGAAIFSFEENGLCALPYTDVDHVAITRDFLANPELFLRHL